MPWLKLSHKKSASERDISIIQKDPDTGEEFEIAEAGETPEFDKLDIAQAENMLAALKSGTVPETLMAIIKDLYAKSPEYQEMPFDAFMNVYLENTLPLLENAISQLHEGVIPTQLKK